MRTTMLGPVDERARPLLRAVRRTMGAGWCDSCQEKPEAVVCKDDSIMVRLDDLWFFFDPVTGDLMSRRWLSNGKLEFGTVEKDGSICWDRAVA